MTHSNMKKKGKTVSKKKSTSQQSSSQQQDMPRQAGTRRARAQSESSVGDVQPAAKKNKFAVTVEDVPDEDDPPSAGEDEEGELSKATSSAK
jgi:hypothetical protein